MHKNNVHHHLKGTAFARCNNKRKLHQQILWAQASCFTCWSGIYTWQGKYQCVRLHRTAFSYLVNATQAVKQISHTVCLFCHPVPEYFHLKKNINTISCKYNYQPSFTSISYQKKVFYIITDASNCHLKPSLILLLTGCDSQNTVTTVSKYADPQPSGAVPFDLSVSNNMPIFVHILISLYLVPSTPYHQVSSGSVLASQLKLPDTHATCLLARIQIELQTSWLTKPRLKRDSHHLPPWLLLFPFVHIGESVPHTSLPNTTAGLTSRPLLTFSSSLSPFSSTSTNTLSLHWFHGCS